MRSFKKLLVSALVSATLCQSGASAIPTGFEIAAGVGVPLTAVGLIVSLAYCNSKKNDKFQDALNASYKYFGDYSPNKVPDLTLLKSQKEKAFDEGVSRAKEKIIRCIGKDKCDILYKIGRRAKFNWDEYKYLGIDPFYLKDVDSVIVTDEKKQSVELSGERLSSFLNSKDEKILGFFLPGGVKAIIDNAFEPIAAGVQSVAQVNKCDFVGDWGDGLILTHSHEASYLVFVSKNSKSIKIVYENWHKQSCTVILSVQ